MISLAGSSQKGWHEILTLGNFWVCALTCESGGSRMTFCTNALCVLGCKAVTKADTATCRLKARRKLGKSSLWGSWMLTRPMVLLSSQQRQICLQLSLPSRSWRRRRKTRSQQLQLCNRCVNDSSMCVYIKSSRSKQRIVLRAWYLWAWKVKLGWDWERHTQMCVYGRCEKLSFIVYSSVFIGVD